MKTSKPENFKKWIDALRSGDYKQGRDALRDGDRFCCLGVACDIAKEDLGIDWKPVEGFMHGSHSFDDQDGLPPGSVFDWLGLGGRLAVGAYLKDGRSVVTLNDSERRDFEYIADALERECL